MTNKAYSTQHGQDKFSLSTCSFCTIRRHS